MTELLIHPSHELYLQHQSGEVLGAVEWDLARAVRRLLAGRLPQKKPNRRDHFFYTFGRRRRLRLRLTPTESKRLARYRSPDRSRSAVERMIEAHAQKLGYVIGTHVCGTFCGPDCPQKKRG